MVVTASNVICVSKSTQVWKDGDVSYRVLLSAGDGTKPVEVDVETKAEWEKIVEIDARYDCDINLESNGYRKYATLEACKAQ